MHLPGIAWRITLFVVCLGSTVAANPLIQSISSMVKYGLPGWIVGRKIERLCLSEYYTRTDLANREKKNNLDATSYTSAFDNSYPLPNKVFMVCDEAARQANIGKGILFTPDRSVDTAAARGRIVLLSPDYVARIKLAIKAKNRSQLSPCIHAIYHELEHIRHNDGIYRIVALFASYAAAEVSTYCAEKIIIRRKLPSAALSMGLLTSKIAATFIGYYAYVRYQERRADYKSLQYFKDKNDIDSIIQEYNHWSDKYCSYLKGKIAAKSYLKTLSIYMDQYPQVAALVCSAALPIIDPEHPSLASRIRQAERYKTQLLHKQDAAKK